MKKVRIDFYSSYIKFYIIFFLFEVCGEYKSSTTRGIFDNYEINKEINELNKVNISEPALCVYKFIANKNEKVLIKFDTFDVKSHTPE